MMIAAGSLEYAHARLSARYGERPDELAWRRIEHVRELPALLDAARASALAPLDRAASRRAARRTRSSARCAATGASLVAEVAGWMPEDWQAAVALVRGARRPRRRCSISRAAARRRRGCATTRSTATSPSASRRGFGAAPADGALAPLAAGVGRARPHRRAVAGRMAAAAPAGEARRPRADRRGWARDGRASRRVPRPRGARRLAAAPRAAGAAVDRSSGARCSIPPPRSSSSRWRRSTSSGCAASSCAAPRLPARCRLVVMIRPKPARWFEILAARDDATLALEALATTGAVELEARAERRAAGRARRPAPAALRVRRARARATAPTGRRRRIAASRVSRAAGDHARAQPRAPARVGRGGRAGDPAAAARRGRARRAAAVAAGAARRSASPSSTSRGSAGAGPVLHARLFVFPPDSDARAAAAAR